MRVGRGERGQGTSEMKSGVGDGMIAGRDIR